MRLNKDQITSISVERKFCDHEDDEVVEKQNLLRKNKMEILNTVKEKYDNEKLPPLVLKELIKRFELQCERIELAKMENCGREYSISQLYTLFERIFNV